MNTVQVYLLDLSMKNPTVENSSVSYVNSNSLVINCKSENIYFACIKPKEKLITQCYKFLFFKNYDIIIFN